MKANELRIGNWVTIGDSNPFQITGIFHEYVWALINETDFPVKDLKPIPLTEEWLLKFGFELHPWGWVKHSFLIRWSKTKFWLEVGNGTRIEFVHVHTLQNFFALTGNELEIKL